MGMEVDNSVSSKGLQSYAYKQIHIWSTFASKAQEAFEQVLGNQL